MVIHTQMPTKSRRILFYGLVLIFLVLGSGISLYASGYRLNLSNLHLVKVGGLFVRSLPQDVAIWLDDKSIQNKTGLLSGGTFVTGVYPKNYKLELYAEGYRDWKRNVSVAPALVTEIKHALLIPKESRKISERAVDDFWLTGESVVEKSPSGKIYLTGTTSTLPGTVLLGSTGDGKIILSKDAKKRYWTNQDQATSTVLENILTKGNSLRPEDMLMLDENGDVLVQKQNSILDIDASAKQTSVVTTTTSNMRMERLSPSRFWLAWTVYDPKQDEFQVQVYDKLLNDTGDAGGKISGQAIQVGWANNSILGILSSKGEMYWYKVGDRNWNHVSSDGHSFAFNQDGTMLAVAESRSLEVFNLNDKQQYWRFNLTGINEVKGAWWHKDNDHILLEYPDKVMLLDLEDKSLQNFEVLAQTNHATYYPDQSQFYYLKDSLVYRLDLPQ